MGRRVLWTKHRSSGPLPGGCFLLHYVCSEAESHTSSERSTRGCRLPEKASVKKSSRGVLTAEKALAYKPPIDAAADANRRRTLPWKCRAHLPDLGREWVLFSLEALTFGWGSRALRKKFRNAVDKESR